MPYSAGKVLLGGANSVPTILADSVHSTQKNGPQIVQNILKHSVIQNKGNKHSVIQKDINT